MITESIVPPVKMTPRRRRVLKAFIEHFHAHGHWPSATHVASKIGLTPSGVSLALGHMRSDGWLDFKPCHIASLRVSKVVADAAVNE